MDPDAQKLIDSLRAGDESAATQLILQFYERIYAFLRRLAGSDEDAADLTQRVYQRIWKSLDGFEGRASLSSWLHAVAWHIYADWVRSRKPADPRTDLWWESCPAIEPSPFEVLAERDSAAVAFRAVDQLSEDLRSTVHLHYYQGLTLQETADALGTATSTVKYRLRIALTQLRTHLNEALTPGGRRH